MTQATDRTEVSFDEELERSASRSSGGPRRLSTAQAPWAGRLRIAENQRGFVDEKGRFVLPLCAHFGEAFSAYVRRPSAVEDQLRAIRAAGYDCIRFWDNLGEYSVAWGGKEVTPFTWTNGEGVRVTATPGYYGKLRDFVGVLEQTGLGAHHSRGDLGRATPAVPIAQVVEHSRKVAEMYDQVGWSVLALYEANNENFQNGNYGLSELRRIVEPIERGGALVASSCPGVECTEQAADVLAWSAGFSVRYYHGYRIGTAVDRLKRKFSTAYEAPAGAPRLGWEGEPIGPNNFPGGGVSVNHTEDVEELGLLSAMTFIARSAFTYMSQYGVFWNGRIERQSGFLVVPTMRDTLYAFAPDIMAWPTLVHGGRAEAVLRSPTGYYDEGGTVAYGPARIDQIISPDRRTAVAIVYGGRGAKRVRNDMGCRAEMTVVWPREDETVQRDVFTLAPGASLAVEYRIGRLLLAQCRPATR